MLSRSTTRDRNARWQQIARVAAFLLVVVVAWICIAPDVDLLDSTADQPTIMKILLSVPAVAVAAPELRAATQIGDPHAVFDTGRSATGTETLPWTCTWVC
jgi:hypothetical protein